MTPRRDHRIVESLKKTFTRECGDAAERDKRADEDAAATAVAAAITVVVL